MIDLPNKLTNALTSFFNALGKPTRLIHLRQVDKGCRGNGLLGNIYR